MVGFSLYQLVYLGGWRSYNWMTTLSEVCSSSIGLALLSVVVLEGGVFVVLFAPRRIRQLIERGRRQVIEEVRGYNSKVIAWQMRKKEAQADGQPFDEPRPEPPEYLRD
jgi:hypothetical protein